MFVLIVCIVAVCAFLYSIRARTVSSATIFSPPQHLPFFGSMIDVLSNIDHHHDWKLALVRQAWAKGKEISCWSMMAAPTYFETGSARMVEHMLKSEFESFEKGPDFQAIFKEILGEGIFNSDGERWREQRKVASHMFSSRQLNEYMLSTFQEHAKLVLAKLDQVASKEFGVIDMQDMFFRFTLDSICKIAFGLDVGSLGSGSDKQPAFATAFDLAQEVCAFRWFVPPFVWRAQRFFGIGGEGRLPGYVRTIDQFVMGVIKTRRETLSQYENSGDLLSLFLHAAQREGRELTDTFLRDVILNFMIAGRDTTACALTYIFKVLSERPDIDSAVADEVYKVVGEDGIPDESQLKDLRFLEAVFLEAVRLYPPVSTDVKVSTKETTFPDGSVIPKGSFVGYSPFVLNRLHEVWGADAEDFKPDRWLDEDGKVVAVSNFKYASFNAGPRLCLGKQMAINEAKVLAAAIVSKFKLAIVPGHNTNYRLTIVLAMAHGLKMTVRPRNNEL